MRNLLLVTWLALPIGAWAYHEGPGQDRMALDEAAKVVAEAHQAAADKDWADAVRGYEDALAKLPKDQESTAQRLRLELNKARMQAKGLSTAREELESLVDELATDQKADPQLLAESRQALARAQFFTTWLMRLEGVSREEWEPEIEAARQNWRLLAEQATTPEQKEQSGKDLEAAIRLARIEIEDLQGLPLPSE
ncbi:MAG: hypothetical protein IT456_06980 [Planctomycetes bacterium]|jgi:hypothetical protein|nr:hypothetical protein [Planctomycetota bacterium]